MINSQDKLALRLQLSDSVGTFMKLVDDRPRFSEDGEQWRDYYQKTASNYLDTLHKNVRLASDISGKLYKIEVESWEIWSAPKISYVQMPQIMKKIEDVSAFLKQPLGQILCGKNEIRMIASTRENLQQLSSNLCNMMYYKLPDEVYIKMYDTRLKQSGCRQNDVRYANMIRNLAQLPDGIYCKSVTDDLNGADLCRFVFTSGYNETDVKQYFSYIYFEQQSNETTTGTMSFADEIQKINDDIFAKERKLLKGELAKLNVRLVLPYTALWVNQMVDALFSSKQNDVLVYDLKHRKEKKCIGMIVGILARHGIYGNKTDDALAKLLDFPNILHQSVAKYINTGRHNEERSSYIDWIDEYITMQSSD